MMNNDFIVYDRNCLSLSVSLFFFFFFFFFRLLALHK